MTKRELRFIIIAGIVVNAIAAVGNYDKGGWWLVFLPLHAIVIGMCIWSWRRCRAKSII